MDKDILIWPAEVHFLKIISPDLQPLSQYSHPYKSHCDDCIGVDLSFSVLAIQMKLPSSVGQKKIKAIEQILMEQGVGKWSAIS